MQHLLVSRLAPPPQGTSSETNKLIHTNLRMPSPSPRRHMTTAEPQLSSRARKRAASEFLPPPSVPHLAVDQYEDWMDSLDVNKPIPRLYPLQRSETLRQQTESSKRRVEEAHVSSGSSSNMTAHPMLAKNQSDSFHKEFSINSALLEHTSGRSGGSVVSPVARGSLSPAPRLSGSPSPRWAPSMGGGGGAPSPHPPLRRQGSIRLTLAASGTTQVGPLTGIIPTSEKRSLRHLVKKSKEIRHYLIYLLSIGSSDPRDDLSPADLTQETRQLITQLFAALDRDGDGLIFYDDLQVAVPIAGLEYFSEVQYRRLLIDGHVLPPSGAVAVVPAKGGSPAPSPPSGVVRRSAASLVRFHDDAGEATTASLSPAKAGTLSHSPKPPGRAKPVAVTAGGSTGTAFLSNGIGMRNFYKLLFPQLSLMRIVTILKEMEHPTEKKKTARQLLAPSHVAEIERLFNFFISQETERIRLTALEAGKEPSNQLTSTKNLIAVSPTTQRSSLRDSEDGGGAPLKRRQSTMALKRKDSVINLAGSTVGLSRFRAAVGKLTTARHSSVSGGSPAVPTISIAEIVAPVIDPQQTTLPTVPITSGSTSTRLGSPPVNADDLMENHSKTMNDVLKEKAIEHYEQHDIDGDGRLTLEEYIEAMKHNYPPYKVTDKYSTMLFDLTISTVPKRGDQGGREMSTGELGDQNRGGGGGAHPGMRGNITSIFKLDNGPAYVDSVCESGRRLVEINHAQIVKHYSPSPVVRQFDGLSEGTTTSKSPSRPSPLLQTHIPKSPTLSPLLKSGGGGGRNGISSEVSALRPQTFLRIPDSPRPFEPFGGSLEMEEASTSPLAEKTARSDSLPSARQGAPIELRPLAPYTVLTPQKYGSKLLQNVKDSIGRDWRPNELNAEQLLAEGRSYGEGRVSNLKATWDTSNAPQSM